MPLNLFNKEATAKKIYPRVTLRSSAIVVSEDGARINVVSLDASADDLCIQCTTKDRNKLTPQGSYLCNGRPLELVLWLELPGSEHENRGIEARCQITFSRRIARDTCHIGLRFKSIASEDHARLIQFLDNESAVSAA